MISPLALLSAKYPMKKAVKRQSVPLFEKTIEPPKEIEDIVVVDGKRGYWRTISNIRVFLPIGGEWKDVRNHIGDILHERWKKNDAKRQEREAKFKEDRVSEEKKLERGTVDSIVNDKTTSKPTVFKTAMGDISFKGHNGSVAISGGIIKKIKDGLQAREDIKEKGVTPFQKEYIQQFIDSGNSIFESLNAISDAWNKLPQEYRNDVDVFEVRGSIQGGENGGIFRPDQTKQYKTKVEVAMADPQFVRGVVRHEMAHARWHKIPKNVRNDMIEKVIKSGNLGHTKYAASWKAVWDEKEKKLQRLKKHGSKRWYSSEEARKKDEVKRIKNLETYADNCRDHWVNEIHSEWFAVRDHPDYRGDEKIDMKQFAEIGKIFESVMGKEYMEKAVTELESLDNKYKMVGDQLIFYLDKNMMMTEFSVDAKYLSTYGLDVDGNMRVHTITPYESTK